VPKAESCHRFLNNPGTFTAEPGFGDLISKLVETTHRLVAADPLNATAISNLFEAQRSRAQISPVSLAWSIAQSVSRDVNLQASIVHVTSFVFNIHHSLSDPFPQGWVKP
jgi:hypothetical protein